MKRVFRRVATCLLVVCAVLVASNFLTTQPVQVVHASDEDFFAGLWACDDNGYTATLEQCRSQSGYPVSPDESECRANAGIAFGTCLDGVGSPSYGLDFCAMARARRDACANIYGIYAQYLDVPAYGECYDSSGVSACE